MTALEFRADSKRVVMLREALQMPIMAEALSVLAEEHPATREIRSDISPTFAAVRLGHAAGFSECIESLHALAMHPPDNAPVEAEYVREPEE